MEKEKTVYKIKCDSLITFEENILLFDNGSNPTFEDIAKKYKIRYHISIGRFMNKRFFRHADS